jgi:hypothetical protein
MPIVNSQAEGQEGPVVSPRFWIYWAITIPVTLLVLAIWGVWIRVVMYMHRKEDDGLLTRDVYNYDEVGKA